MRQIGDLKAVEVVWINWFMPLVERNWWQEARSCTLLNCFRWRTTHLYQLRAWLQKHNLEKAADKWGELSLSHTITYIIALFVQLTCLSCLSQFASYTTAACGKAYPVELPSSNSLRRTQGVRYVIHVLGPNMNPNKPECLNDDFEKVC